MGVPWLNTPDDLAVVAQRTAASGVLVVAGALDGEEMVTVSRLRALDVHVHQIDDTWHRPSIRMLPMLHRSDALGASASAPPSPRPTFVLPGPQGRRID